jgi:hypothetical protein
MGGHVYDVVFADDEEYYVYKYGTYKSKDPIKLAKLAHAWHTYWHADPNDIDRAIPVDLPKSALDSMNDYEETYDGYSFKVTHEQEHNCNDGVCGIKKVIKVWCGCAALDDYYSGTLVPNDSKHYAKLLEECNKK